MGSIVVVVGLGSWLVVELAVGLRPVRSGVASGADCAELRQQQMFEHD